MLSNQQGLDMIKHVSYSNQERQACQGHLFLLCCQETVYLAYMFFLFLQLHFNSCYPQRLLLTLADLMCSSRVKNNILYGVVVDMIVCFCFSKNDLLENKVSKDGKFCIV